MAILANPLALDGTHLMPDTNPKTNAAIWFAVDGFDPVAKGINGRRVAGESFLRGFFRHADVAEFVSLAHNRSDHDAFATVAKNLGVQKPLRPVFLHNPTQLTPTEVVFYPSPLNARECWRRAPFGNAAWALCGITHTTATQRVMDSVFDIRSAPQMPWDALICTSASVQSSMRTLMVLAEEHLARRFPGSVLPARPLLPVIPLGVHCDDHRPDAKAGKALRDRLGAGKQDIVISTIARLTADEKFDPFPLFIALEAAAPTLAKQGGRFHLAFCGQFRPDRWKTAFAEGARQLAPSISYHHLDGGNPTERKATLSASDIFIFPIDNLQETFGLAPVEAMAAGLPVIVSDWDGMKDTVPPEVGIRVPTEMTRLGDTTYLSLRHHGGTDSYLQYLGQISALTRLHIGQLTHAINRLATDQALRTRMGAAAKAHADRHYDWRVVIPQMQELWGEQTAMLAHARTKGGALVAPLNPARLPNGPAVELMFSSYPTSPAPDADRKLRAVALGPRPNVAQTFALRQYSASQRLIETPARLQQVADAFAASKATGATVAEIATQLKLSNSVVVRSALWLLKYHFLEETS